jgi:mRNA-degrading endonuclease RelE of RelBE toxin-antitoxin system
MKYHVALKPRAIKDLIDLPKEEASKIIDRLALLEDNLKGDVKKLTHRVSY